METIPGKRKSFISLGHYLIALNYQESLQNFAACNQQAVTTLFGFF